MPIEFATAGLATFVTGATLGALAALAALACGFWWGRRTALPPASLEQHAEQVLKLLQGVSRFTHGIAGDVSEHQEQLREMLHRLSDAKEHPPADADDTCKLLQEIVTANESLQRRLDQAELTLQSQASEIAGYACEARTDPLTDLPNRRSFDDDLTQRFAQWRRYGAEVSVVMVDIDHFKAFNDVHGHLAGDAILTQVAQMVRDSMRRSDIVTRFGGEEFAIILPNTALEDAASVACGAAAVIRKASFDYEGEALQVTVSVGVAQAAADDTTISLVKRADAALYASKRAGRDCVHYHGGQTIERVDCDNRARTVSAAAPEQLQKASSTNFSQLCGDLRERLHEVVAGQ